MRRPLHSTLADAGSSPWLGRLLVVLCVSVAYESLFLVHSLNRMDESWPLYAGMQLHAGGRLYDDVLWVFPPGHVWIGWLSWWLDPPGFILARLLYSVFAVALCAGVYFLARRLMPEPFALLAGLLVALAAPRSHLGHLLFGYRYLILVVLALLAYDRRLRGGSALWMWVSGAWMGVALTFRVTPAFSASCGIAVALLAASPSFRRCIQDGLRFSGGLAIVVVPVLAYFAAGVGLGRLWQEVILHPLEMLQALPLPEIRWPSDGGRIPIYRFFVALQFRLIWVLYFGYLAVLAALWVRARRRGEPFRHGLLTAVVVFGAVFFVRSTGRSDEAHLDSVIAPVCLVFAHLSAWLFTALWPGDGSGGAGFGWRSVSAHGLGAALLGSWIFLLGVDESSRLRVRGGWPLESVGGTILMQPRFHVENIDRVVRLIEEATQPDDRILNLSATPMFHVLTGRLGPGHRDLIMPGTFFDDAEERRFLARLRSDPPAAVVWPVRAFDRMRSRSHKATAPRVTAWVERNYEKLPGQEWDEPIHRGELRWFVLVPRGAP